MMKRRILLLILALTLCVSLLAGCHGSEDKVSFAVPDSFDDNKQYEISFWAKNDTNLTQVAVYRQAVEDFQALYPNIKVNLKLYTDYGRIYSDVITNIATNTTPNVCITYPDHIATYMSGEDTVVPLGDLVSDKRFGLGGSELRFDGPEGDEMVEKFMEECKIGGELYALPYMRSTEACYVNKTYVEALGFTLPETLTWDFMWEVAEAATAKDADGNYTVNGQKVMIPVIYKSTDNMMIQMLKQKDAGYSTSRGEIEIFNETTEEILREIAVHAESGAFSTFKISSYPANFLNAGQCIFAIDSTAGATWMGCDAPLIDISEENLVDFETVVYPVPQYDIEDPQMISQGPSVCIFNKEDPGEVLASWLFMQFLLTDRVQIDYATTEGYAPVTLKAQNSDEYRDYLSREGEDNDYYYDIKLKATKLLIENTENTFVTPVFNGSTSLRNAAGQMIENVTKSVRRHQVIDDAYIETLYDDMISLYRLDGIGGSLSGKAELGELPTASVVLMAVLGATWVCLAAYFIKEKIKGSKK